MFNALNLSMTSMHNSTRLHLSAALSLRSASPFAEGALPASAYKEKALYSCYEEKHD